MTRREFIQLYDEQVALVRSVLHRVLPAGPARLDDLTQEVFLRAWRARDGFRGEAQARTWLCRIARNVALDVLKQPGHLREVESVDGMGASAAAHPDPSDRVVVRELLAQLVPDDRMLLVMLCVEGFSMVEISDVLDIPVGTAKSRAFSLRARLRAALEPQEVAS